MRGVSPQARPVGHLRLLGVVGGVEGGEESESLVVAAEGGEAAEVKIHALALGSPALLFRRFVAQGEASKAWRLAHEQCPALYAPSHHLRGFGVLVA